MDNGIALMWVGIGVLFAAMALPLKLRKVKMNSFYGYRTALSYRSDKDWYALNEYAGRLMLFYSIPIIVLGIFLLFVSSEFVNAHRLVLSYGPNRGHAGSAFALYV